MRIYKFTHIKNSGLLLIDTARFNAGGAGDKMSDLILKPAGGAQTYLDQSTINAALKGDWAELLSLSDPAFCQAAQGMDPCAFPSSNLRGHLRYFIKYITGLRRFVPEMDRPEETALVNQI